MKVLTLTQPWATLVILGVKRYETRSWSTSHRGPLAIHAAKGWKADDAAFAEDLFRRGLLPIPDVVYALPRGAILGTVRLVDVVPTRGFEDLTVLEDDLGDFSPGRYAWQLAAPIPFPDPVPARGMLGLWDWT